MSINEIRNIKTRQLNIRISHREHAALFRYAQEEGTDVTTLFRGYAQSLVRQQEEKDRKRETGHRAA